MWWVIGIMYALLVLFVLGACVCAGRADEAAELELRRLRELSDD